MSNKYLKIGMLVLLVTCIFMGCVGEQNANANSDNTLVGTGVSVLHDDVNNVTIYILYQDAIAVVPDWQLTAPKNTTE